MIIRPWTLNAISVHPVAWHYAQSQAEYVLEYVPFQWRPVFVLQWNDCLDMSAIFLSYASTYFTFVFWPATRFYSFALFFVSVHVCSENGIFNYVPLCSTLSFYALPLKSCLLGLTHFLHVELKCFYDCYSCSLDRQVCFSVCVREQWLLRMYWDFKPCWIDGRTTMLKYFCADCNTFKLSLHIFGPLLTAL